MGNIGFGSYGVWYGGRVEPELAVLVERLGFGTLWLGSSPKADLANAEQLLDATETLVVATGIVNIWAAPADEVGRSYQRIAARHADRFMLGIGAGHPEMSSEFTRPYEALNRYLDVLDAAGVPRQRRLLAALGPRVLRLAAERTAGAHPYLVTPEYTRQAREILGPGVLLAPEQKVVLHLTPSEARTAATPTLRTYLGMRNYVSNLQRIGFSAEEVQGDGSDRLFDAMVLHGETEQIAAGLRAHLEAGADHVALQLIASPDVHAGYRELAAALDI